MIRVIAGKIWALMMKPMKNFNVENRAQRVLSLEKPEPAPKHRQNVLELERIMKENPNIAEQFSRKDANLDDRLKKVFVSSEDLPQDDHLSSSRYNPAKPLPTNKRAVEDFEFGMKLPDNVEFGYIDLRNLLKLIGEYTTHPNIPPSLMAKKYNLNEDVVVDIVKYYGAFNLHVPKKKAKKSAYDEIEIIKAIASDDKKYFER